MAFRQPKLGKLELPADNSIQALLARTLTILEAKLMDPREPDLTLVAIPQTSHSSCWGVLYGALAVAGAEDVLLPAARDCSEFWSEMNWLHSEYSFLV